MKTLRIGTWTSKLAMAQAALVKDALLQAHPDLSVELVGIDAESEPKNGVVDNAAFVSTLHEAVMAERVDCAIHGFRDIHQTQTMAFGKMVLFKRQNPRDVVVFRSDIMDVLRIGKTIRLGTSNILRAYNVPNFLKNALPAVNKEPIQIETGLIRGTVDDYLTQLNDGTFDAVIMTAAGLKLLKNDSTITQMLARKKFMILPLTDCPTTPGQGVLAIECRETDKETIDLVSALEDRKIAPHVVRELQAARPLGDCVGATSITTRHFPDYILFVKGIDQNDNDIKTARTLLVSMETLEGKAWDGTQIRSQVANTDYLPVDPNSLTAPCVFIAHSRAAHLDLISTLKDKTIWTSGSQSWFRLAQQGIWVQGCTEELGNEILQQAIEQAPFLKLPSFDTWQILTHNQTVNDWAATQVLATYSITNTFDTKAAEELKDAKHIFWSSASQYQLYKDHVANDSLHYCRAGKTADALKSSDLSPLTVFPNSEMWRQCLTTSS